MSSLTKLAKFPAVESAVTTLKELLGNTPSWEKLAELSKSPLHWSDPRVSDVKSSLYMNQLLRGDNSVAPDVDVPRLNNTIDWLWEGSYPKESLYRGLTTEAPLPRAGDILSGQGIGSFSYDPAVASRFAQFGNSTGDPTKSKVLYRIKNPSGESGQVVPGMGEYEVALPPEQRFKVLSVRETPEGTLVDVAPTSGLTTNRSSQFYSAAPLTALSGESNEQGR